MNKKSGFTLIELLVVIAIIGILSSVVLASLNTARGKGADAAVKEDLNNMRAQAELQYDTAGGTYAGVCANTNVTQALTNAAASGPSGTTVAAANAAGSATTVACDNAAGSWVIQAPLKGAGGYWCVDNSGNAKAEAAASAASATGCI